MVKGKQRNNFAKLSLEARKRVLFLMFDGATYDAIRSDPVVKKCCEERKLTLHSNTFLAIKDGQEYAEYKAALADTENRTKSMRWAAETMRSVTGAQDIADMTQVTLLENLRQLAESGGADSETVKQMRGLAQSLAALSNSAKDRQIAGLKQKITDMEAAHKAELTKKDEEISKRDAEIALLKDGRTNKGISEATLREVEEKIKLL